MNNKKPQQLAIWFHGNLSFFQNLHQQTSCDGDETTFKSLILHETPGSKGKFL